MSRPPVVTRETPLVPSSMSLTHSLTSPSPRSVSQPSASFHPVSLPVRRRSSSDCSPSDSFPQRLPLLWACRAWLWLEPLINLMHVASLTHPPIFLRRPMALAICARCMLVKRYPLKHTLRILGMFHIVLFSYKRVQPSKRFHCHVIVYTVSVFFY